MGATPFFEETEIEMTLDELEKYHKDKKKEPTTYCQYPPFGGVVTTDVPKWLQQSKPSTSCNQCVHWGEAWETGETRMCMKKRQKTHIVYTCDLFTKSVASATKLRELRNDEADPYQNFID